MLADFLYEKLKSRLVSIRGVGNWTKDYTIIKCFHINDAFPIADVGVHNALKGILGLDKKPTIAEIWEILNKKLDICNDAQ
jgi:DNA-3-methyladenine glycosylase II